MQPEERYTWTPEYPGWVCGVRGPGPLRRKLPPGILASRDELTREGFTIPAGITDPDLQEGLPFRGRGKGRLALHSGGPQECLFVFPTQF